MTKFNFDGTGSYRDLDFTVKSVEKAQFVDWLCTPKRLREPASLVQMAEALGVTRQTLYNWRRDPRVIQQVRGRLQGQISVQFLPDIVDSLKKMATDPKHPRAVPAAKLLVELMEKGEPLMSDTPLAEKSLKELKVLVADLYDEIDERSETA